MMILQPSNVELTKIHYYEKNIAGEKIPTISQEVEEKIAERNVIIKKNIFGHKWVLKVNENDEDVKKNSRLKLLVYIFVFLSITVAVGFGIFFSFNNTIFRRKEQYVKDYIYPEEAGIRSRPMPESINVTLIPIDDTKDYTEDEYTPPTTERKPYCNDCLPTEVCLKINDTSKPECTSALYVDDPTGCGGLCLINVEYCQKLSQKHDVYQCSPRIYVLTCDDDQFNCQNMCISEDKRCDGNIDCSNRLDEENCDCNLSTHFQCGENTSCLDLILKCNQIIDCWDGSDEQNCYYVNECSPDQFRCNDGQCVNQSEVCDGVFDCIDRSDEPYGCMDDQ